MSPSLETVLTATRGLLEQGAYSAAIELLDSNCFEMQRMTSWHRMRGEALLALGRPKEALEALSHSRALYERDPRVWLLLARTFFALEEWREVLRHCDVALEYAAETQGIAYQVSQIRESAVDRLDIIGARMASAAADRQIGALSAALVEIRNDRHLFDATSLHLSLRSAGSTATHRLCRGVLAAVTEPRALLVLTANLIDDALSQPGVLPAGPKELAELIRHLERLSPAVGEAMRQQLVRSHFLSRISALLYQSAAQSTDGELEDVMLLARGLISVVRGHYR